MSEQLPNFESNREQQPSPETNEQVERNMERLDEAAERAPEASEQAEQARNKVEEHAATTNEAAFNKAERPQAEIPRDRDTKQQLYQQTLSTLQRSMKPVSRQFSRFIHNKTVEQTSEVLGKTVFRPSAVLGATLVWFIGMLIIYGVARHHGFALSGSEFIFLIAIGAVVGLIVEFVQSRFKKKDVHKN